MKSTLLALLISIISIATYGQCAPGTITGANSILVGDLTTLSDTAAGGSWSSSNPAIVTVNPTTGIVTGNSRGSAVITYTLGGACSAYYATQPITITSGLTGHIKVCVSDTTRWAATYAGGTWSTSSSAIATVNSATGLIKGLSTGSVVISYSFTSAGTGYVATDSFIVAPVPSAGLITGSPGICPGISGYLADTATTGIWLSSNPSVASLYGMSAHGTYITGVTTGTTLITFTSSYCTLSWDTVRFTVYPNPASLVDTDYYLCIGDTVTLRQTGDVASSFGTWALAFDTTAFSVSSTGFFVTALHLGYSNIIYNDSNTFGCYAHSWAEIDVDSPITPAPIVGPDYVNLGLTASYLDSSNVSLVSAITWGQVWRVTDGTIASINFATGTVTGLTVGTTTISYLPWNGCNMPISSKIIHVVPAVAAATTKDFTAYYERACDSTIFYVSLPSHSATYNMATIYGDGHTQTRSIMSDTVLNYTSFAHAYPSPGTYTIKQVLYNGATPLDSVSFSYEHLLCNEVALYFYVDNNSNCIFDSSSEHLNYHPLRVAIDSNGFAIDTIPVTSGLYYTAYGVPGSVYSFSILNDSSLAISCPSSGVIYDTIGTTVATNRLVALTCSSASGFDLAQNNSFIAGRHSAEGNILLSNVHCAPENAVVTLHISTKYVFGSSTPVPTSIVGNTVTWDFIGVSLASIPANITYYLDIPTSTWLTPGDTVHNGIFVTPTTGDLDTTNNNVIRIDTVKSSWDPNHIAVSPEGDILNGTKLNYSITFENDGNDTAQNIYVMDTLSDNLNPYSLRIVSASAVMNTTVIHASGHNIVKFDFPGIRLLDSTHHVQCRGVVLYTINARNGLADGTHIYSHAGIYFDDNAVVPTDTAINTILVPHLSIASSHGDSVCTGDTAHFIATPHSLNTPHYRWFVNSAPTGTDSSGLTIDGVTIGDTVSCIMTTIMDDSIYSTSNYVILISHGLPSAGTISGTSVVCPGSGITLSETVGTGLWSASNTHASVTGGVVSGTSAGAVTITFTVTNGCGTSYATYPIIVDPLPVAGAVTGATSVCQGSSITLADSTSGGTWSLTNSHATHSGAVMTGASAGLDTAVYTIANYCGAATARMAFTVIATVAPTISIAVHPGDTLCAGDTVTFTQTHTNGGTTPVYAWEKFGITVGTDSTYTYVPALGDVISCVMISDAICPSPDTVISASIAMVVIPIVTPTDVISTSIGDSVTYLGQLVTFNSVNSYCGSSATHQWYLNGSPIPGATSLSYTSTVNSNDTVYCVNYCNTPCATTLVDTSNTMIIYATYLGVADINAFSRLVLFPNPNNGRFEFTGTLSSFSNEPVKYDVLDVTGKVWLSGATLPKNGVVHETLSLETSQGQRVASGQYMLRVMSGSTVQYLHFVVE